MAKLFRLMITELEEFCLCRKMEKAVPAPKITVK